MPSPWGGATLSIQMLYYLLVTVYVLVCFFLIVVILLQQGKGGDIASAFGGGSSQAAFGARSGATLLTRATSVLAALFVVLSLVLTAWGQRGPGSVVGGIDAPPPAPLPAATQPAPATTTPPAQPETTPPAQPATTTPPPPGGATPPPQ
ncbi:MAG: preprotein translocase subunit SecG [Vicinamibacterales bacterium]